MDFHVLGVKTNIEYLLDIMRDSEFRAGRLHTAFLAERFPKWTPADGVPDEALMALAAAKLTGESRPIRAEHRADSEVFNPWRTTGGWRN